MRQFLFGMLVFSACFIGGQKTVSAQPFAHAGEYMDLLSAESSRFNENLWAYVKTAAHSKRANKIERERQKLLLTTKNIQNKIRRMPAYEDDASLRDSTWQYYRMVGTVLREDYGKIVDLEAIAEDSYDLMEAYLTAKRQANAKLQEAAQRLQGQQEVFAGRHRVNLVEGERSKTALQLDAAGQVYDYYYEVFLIFFKSHKQEVYLMEAVESGDVNALVQNQRTLAKYAAEGLKKLDTIPAFEEDMMLVETCREVLTFHLDEAGEKGAVFSEFYLSKDLFEKTQKAMESKPKADLTQEDVDRFNASVEKFNSLVNEFNQTSETLNQRRNLLTDKWNRTVERFLDRHVPR